jgi:hypothetical protein
MVFLPYILRIHYDVCQVSYLNGMDATFRTSGYKKPLLLGLLACVNTQCSLLHLWNLRCRFHLPASGKVVETHDCWRLLQQAIF